MTPVWEIDSNGNIIEHYLWDDNEISQAEAAGKTIVTIPWDVPYYQPKYDLVNKVWTEGKDAATILSDAQSLKLVELEDACINAILGNFTATLSDGNTYSFPYDVKSQSRFNGTAGLFSRGVITSVDWTAYLNGTMTKVTLNGTDFNTVMEAGFTHVNDNEEKYRGYYQQVMGCTTPADVNNITWQ